MERISVNRFSFRRKRSHKRDKEKEDNSNNSESTENDLPKMKYIRYVIQIFSLDVAKCNEGFLPVGGGGGGGGGGYSDILIFNTCVGSGHLFGFKILNFNIFWGFQKNEYFWV